MSVDNTLNQALLDIQHISKRFKGLLELADEVEEVKSLLQNKDNLSKLIDERMDVVAEINDTIEIGESRVKSLQKDVNTLEQNYDVRFKDLKKKVEEYESKIDGLSKEFEKRMDAAGVEAEMIITNARDKSEAMVREARAKVDEEEKKLNRITNEINKLREKF